MSISMKNHEDRITALENWTNSDRVVRDKFLTTDTKLSGSTTVSVDTSISNPLFIQIVWSIEDSKQRFTTNQILFPINRTYTIFESTNSAGSQGFSMIVSGENSQTYTFKALVSNQIVWIREVEAFKL